MALNTTALSPVACRATRLATGAIGHVGPHNSNAQPRGRKPVLIWSRPRAIGQLAWPGNGPRHLALANVVLLHFRIGEGMAQQKRHQQILNNRTPLPFQYTLASCPRAPDHLILAKLASNSSAVFFMAVRLSRSSVQTLERAWGSLLHVARAISSNRKVL
jgi:hypothetical protein